MRITPNCAVARDLGHHAPVEISQKTGLAIEACAFIGSSPIRQFAENWTLDHMLKLTEEAVGYAVANGLPVMFVTEDTCRATPDTIRACSSRPSRRAPSASACATRWGHITPRGVRNLIPYVRQLIRETGEDVKIDWHGHNDRGLGVINTITAMTSGVDRVHATALGIGERVATARWTSCSST